MNDIAKLKENVMKLLKVFQQQELGNRLSEFSLMALISLIDKEFIDSTKPNPE